jgi:hypothetical protein
MVCCLKQVISTWLVGLLCPKRGTMSVNPQTQSIAIANQLISLAGQFLSIYQQMVILDAAWSDNGVANIINALGTVALNTDGSLGTTPDGTPVVTHPINPTLYPNLIRSLSATQITQLKTILDNIVTYVNGSAVSATASARGILNSASGG